MIITLYSLIIVHVYAFFGIALGLLKRRLGVLQTLVWEAIGLIILYNIAYNHLLACIVKPNSPKELKKIERMRDI